ncbi:hypothetical protein SK128_023028 [Halocaridina rubra]|uniref:NEDD4-binding protein 2 n=1 Tax=Halocaridina rubra TaxID=373956 RepID=A0AAN8XKY9_HALRR
MASEETDLGEVLTKFEELFGTQVEHEVIKMVLQSCQWDSARAMEMLMSMIDPEKLPQHVRCAILTGTVVRSDGSSPLTNPKPAQDVSSLQNGSRTLSPARSQDGDVGRDGSSPLIPLRMVEDGDDTYYSDGLEEPFDDVEESICDELQTVRRRSLNDSPTSGMSRCLITPSGRVSHNNILTPFAMAQTGIAREPATGYSVPYNIWSMAPTLPLHAAGDVKETVDALSKVVSSDSDSASPQPPRRASAPSLDFETNRVHDCSSWILAPEFVLQRDISGTALNYSKFVKPVVCSQNSKASKKEEIVSKILSGKKMLVLMRGLPGSGKSTLAKEIKGCTGVVLSADDFFCDKFGKYKYESCKLREAHAWNTNRARVKLQESRSPIIIDNTNIQAWEMKPYVKLALHHGYDVDILEPESSWKFTPRDLAKKNIHGVPKQKIKEMLDRYDFNLTIDQLLKSVKEVDTKNGRQPFSKTNWPTTLPNSSSNIEKVLVPDERSGYPGTELHTVTGGSKCSDLIPEAEQAFPYSNDQNCLIKNGYNHSSQEEKIGEDEVLEEDGPDVIIEGYEDFEESDNGANARGNIFLTENQERLEHNSHESLKVNEISTGPPGVSIKNSVLHSEERIRSELHNEERIRTLIDEASADNHTFATDWDDSPVRMNEEDLNDEKFMDLVQSLESSVRYELGKAKGHKENGVPFADSERNLVDLNEDSAMYDLCSHMEDKIGQTLSSAINRPSGGKEPSSLFSIINSNDLVDCNGNTDNSKPIIDSETIKDMKENKISKKIIIDNNGEVLETRSSEQSIVSEHCDIKGRCPEELYNIKTGTNLNCEQIILNECKSRVGEKMVSSSIQILDKQESLENFISHKKVTNALDPNSVAKLTDSVSYKDSSDFVSLTSWECVDINDGDQPITWDNSASNGENNDSNTPKPTRDSRRRMSGDPNKWIDHEDDKMAETDFCGWEPILEGAKASWESNKENTVPQAHTGAVPKTRTNHATSSPVSKHAEHINSKESRSSSISPSAQEATDADIAKLSDPAMETLKVNSETQTLSIDFQALELDNNLYELKILYGQPDYVPAGNSEGLLPDTGPLTKGRLMLEKGIMTENIVETSALKPLKSLVAFFPHIPETDLRDVLEKCKYDLDWTMNVLLDGGYKMAEEFVDAYESEDDSETELMVLNQGTVSPSEGHRRCSPVMYEEHIGDAPSEEKTRRMRQSQQPDDLNCKRDIENSFTLSETVDDRITRLTGKEFDNLNINKIKKKKSKKKHSKKKHQNESLNWAEGEGAQYVTLLMDPLFASQLISMFGPIGSCGLSGDMAPEDRSVILPMELCLQIHKYWTHTLDGKFNHETEILDSLIQEDENLARRLQEEELSSQDMKYRSSGELDNAEKVFELDPPSNFREIMHLEQALQDSKTSSNSVSLSTLLSLQRLYTEFPHVDREALRQEFQDNDHSYQDTLKKVADRYGYKQSTPKVVIAPEFMEEYENQQILKATKLSLEEQEQQGFEVLEEEEYHPDDPQMYRDEAQTHYIQRQECYRKAQEAHKQGLKSAASYYASIGKLHWEKFKDANERASLKILEAVNAKKDANVLDLHLLHVSEALTAAQAFLAEREQVVAARGIQQMQVSLITGHGAHSEGGQARLKPAVKSFLTNKGYKFHEGNIGMFVVTLHNKNNF